ncbi:MAG: DEAD/DEAH box helicase [Pseudomonadota bacterium]|nr:DEAD/DEAH box helicase [Pseudomonadota bacterium]
MNISKFSELGLADPIQRALTERNHETPTPIQAKAIPELLAGEDILGIAQTGTGKTGAFALPILHQLSQNRANNGPRSPRALVMAPTRELAIQIGEEFRAYGKHLHLRQTVIFGGVGQKPQTTALSRGVEIVVATPGRLLDLMGQGHVSLDAVEYLVLDEADRMLDMGFIHDIRKIIGKMPKQRQTLLFSATMPREIATLSGEILSEPVRVEVAPQATPIETIDQRVYHVASGGKKALLETILADPALKRVIVFSRTKHRANRVAEGLDRAGIPAEAIHGNKSQGARQRALKRFKSGDVRVLVATDIAARGIDVDGITHVINFELPNEAESYVHRIGRTARAGATGVALSFCDSSERAYLRDIERLIKQKLTVIGQEPTGPVPAAAKPKGRGRPNKPRGERKNNNRPGNDNNRNRNRRRPSGGSGRGKRAA